MGVNGQGRRKGQAQETMSAYYENVLRVDYAVR